MLFDSTVDNVANPAIFFLYFDAQSYPAYLITYRFYISDWWLWLCEHYRNIFTSLFVSVPSVRCGTDLCSKLTSCHVYSARAFNGGNGGWEFLLVAESCVHCWRQCTLQSRLAQTANKPAGTDEAATRIWRGTAVEKRYTPVWRPDGRSGSPQR